METAAQLSQDKQTYQMAVRFDEQDYLRELGLKDMEIRGLRILNENAARLNDRSVEVMKEQQARIAELEVENDSLKRIVEHRIPEVCAETP